MREEGKTKVFSKMEGVYNRRRHLGGVRKFEEYERLSRRIREGDKRRRSKTSRKRKEKQKVIEVELNPEAEEFKRSELLGKYTARILFRWDDKKFEDEYLKELKRNWTRWKGKEIGEGEASSSRVGTLRGGYCYDARED